MPKLKFKLKTQAHMLSGLDLPIEIRKASSALVERTISSETIRVEPGTYSVSADLPSGQQLLARVQVRKKDAIVILDLDEARRDIEGELPPIARKERKIASSQQLLLHDVYPLIGIPTAILTGLPDKLAQDLLKVEFLSGRTPADAAIISQRTLSDAEVVLGSVVIEHRSGRTKRLNEFLRVTSGINRSVSYTALPVAPGGTVYIHLSNLHQGIANIELHLPNQEGDLLLRGLQRGYLKEAAILAPHVMERLLREKLADPISAAVAAYTILLLGEVERLHNWTENLRNWFAWLPDGMVIRGEHLALLGKHDEAIKEFNGILERGTPLFSVGLSLLMDRLQLYVEAEDRFARSDVRSAKVLLEQLKPVCSAVDWRTAALTLRNPDFLLSTEPSPLANAPAAAPAAATA